MRQNLGIVLLSVIATLLLVLVVQNFSAPSATILAQGGGGAGSTVGVIGVATGTLQGSDASGFWIFNPDSKRLLLYDYGNQHLRLKAVRDVTFDMQANDYNLKGQRGASVSDVRKTVLKGSRKKRRK